MCQGHDDQVCTPGFVRSLSESSISRPGLNLEVVLGLNQGSNEMRGLNTTQVRPNVINWVQANGPLNSTSSSSQVKDNDMVCNSALQRKKEKRKVIKIVKNRNHSQGKGDNRNSQSPAMLVCYVILICRAALWNDELYVGEKVMGQILVYWLSQFYAATELVLCYKVLQQPDQPDLVLFTGDFGNENVEVVRSIVELKAT
ncbi:hypothetical protein LOK49_LG11G01546 [Camellia lanceoleosa]|uniref:Uncharacterized protein n=1 Tax=Camellia lanceoleosa TaxID=1840588 RepID=A0ACC0G6L9_9ERIC|nr:hypothetical protein LOK49_LG11G01546 [Camellia lanceoleosa]